MNLNLGLSFFFLALPSLRDSIRQPLHVFEGEDALLTCVVRNLDSNTLLWKRDDRERGTPRILTAGENRVSSDTRFNVLHDSGVQYFLLRQLFELKLSMETN